jgi:hypothetical protein
VSVELNSRNFDELVIKSKDLWIVEFFAPWYVVQCTCTVHEVTCLILLYLLSLSMAFEYLKE